MTSTSATVTSGTTTGDLLVERRDGVLTLTWNRPDTLNALTPTMLHAAADAIDDRDTGGAETRLVVLTGRGRAFSAGAAISDEIDGGDTLDAANRLVRTIVGADVPVLCAVNGLAAGVAMSVALAGDLTIVTASAYFLPAFVRIGLVPDGGATELVAAAIGRPRATRMLMLGERLPAPAALEAGLVTHVAADDRFAAEVDELVAHLAHGPTLAYRALKRIVTASTLGGLESTIAAEAAAQRSLFGTADQLEGVRAFTERRPPLFSGC